MAKLGGDVKQKMLPAARPHCSQFTVGEGRTAGGRYQCADPLCLPGTGTDHLTESGLDHKSGLYVDQT